MLQTHVLCDAARRLRPQLLQAAAGIERERRLDADVYTNLLSMGAFHLQLNRNYGGAAADPLTLGREARYITVVHHA